MHYLIGILTQGETKQEAHGNALAFADELGVVLDERTGECLEVQRVRHAEGAIKPETERMRGELGVEASCQAQEAVGVVGFDVQLERQLAVDCLDQLAQTRMQVAVSLRRLGAVVAARDGQQADVAVGRAGRPRPPG